MESAANFGLHTHATGISDGVSLDLASRPTIQSRK
jgi:hypothetical protein